VPGEQDESTGTGSGGGGPLGAPTSDSRESPVSSDQDENMVVSGGGVARGSEEDGGSS